ncbi:MAG: adenosylcobinamide-GDP ribazoletransferase [Coriobacteriia bacterium]|nr:adenosylcobinamide-GDP ribazoletransferase [Coriobacteriia bacterium]
MSMFSNHLKAFVLAVRLMSTFPLPALKDEAEYFEAHQNPQAKLVAIPSYFPWVGLLIALVLYVLSRFLERTSLSFYPLVIGAVLFATSLILTRMMHFDGLADVFDAAFGAHDFEKRSQILKDPHIGSFGVIAIVIASLVLVVGFDVLAKGQSTLELFFILPLSRVSATFAAFYLKPAFSSGLGKTMARKPGPHDLFVTILALVLGTYVGLYMYGVQAQALLLVVGLCLSALVPWIIQKAFGGTNGDVMGASIVVTEVLLFLLIFGFY